MLRDATVVMMPAILILAIAAVLFVPLAAADIGPPCSPACDDCAVVCVLAPVQAIVRSIGECEPWC